MNPEEAEAGVHQYDSFHHIVYSEEKEDMFPFAFIFKHNIQFILQEFEDKRYLHYCNLDTES